MSGRSITLARALSNLERVWIYAIVTTSGEVLYVGQTNSPKTRWTAAKIASELGIENASLEVLSVTTRARADEAERQAILHYRGKGQAKLNRHLIGCIAKRAGWARIRWLETGLEFSSTGDVARAFRSVSPSRIWQILKAANGQPVKLNDFDNVTLQNLNN